MSDVITLARLPDVEPVLLSNAYQNGVTIFKSINELYRDLDGLFILVHRRYRPLRSVQASISTDRLIFGLINCLISYRIR
ncbi:hypothetical protein [Loigolactobacillus coryniformis]|uniref:hypothetical protein n=1 Tax=Loigolactobacillus coryniformis TaxID=1610 RepID=UPI0002191893|nr:hypothetical protein [Loigolactobacillus coryniformis]